MCNSDFCTNGYILPERIYFGFDKNNIRKRTILVVESAPAEHGSGNSTSSTPIIAIKQLLFEHWSESHL